MIVCYIGVGSNLGDRQKNIQRAKERLTQQGIRLLRTSPFLESEAIKRSWDTTEHPNYLNCIFEIETNLAPHDLLDRLEAIERSLGRDSKGDWSPRTIDLDILLYGDQVIETQRLKVPHPEIQNRWFVSQPLSVLLSSQRTSL